MIRGSVAHIAEVVPFRLGGETCFRWFDSDGNLCAIGPPRVMRRVDVYIEQFSPIANDSEVLAFVDRIEPLGAENLSIKRHAILELLVEKGRRLCESNRGANLEIDISPDDVKAKVGELRQNPSEH